VDKVTGFLFQAGEPDELAEKIALLAMNSSKRKALGENGYLRQAEHFNTQKFVDSVVHHCLSTINIH
jgi:glycosyltransferase involved in cell wall biosynthesis